MTKFITIMLVAILIFSPVTTLAYGGSSIIINIGPRIDAHRIPERLEEIRKRVQKRYDDIQKRLDSIGNRLNLFLSLR